MKYTFLMPAYKATFLHEAIESVLRQIYRDFRLIVSDDCSPEDLKAIVDEFKDDRIVYRRNEENIGGRSLVEHWNMLLDLCDSDYLIMASDDDVYAPAFLEEADCLAKKYPSVDIIRARVQQLDSEGDVYFRDMPYWEYCEQAEYVYDYFSDTRVPCLSNYVFKTKALKDIGGFVDYPLAWGSDDMTAFVLSANGIVTTKDILFSFRMSGLNISSHNEDRNTVKRKLEAKLLFDADMKKLLEKLEGYENKIMQYKRQKFLYDYNCSMCDALCAYAAFLPFSEMWCMMKRHAIYLNNWYSRINYLRSWFVNIGKR